MIPTEGGKGKRTFCLLHVAGTCGQVTCKSTANSTDSEPVRVQWVLDFHSCNQLLQSLKTDDMCVHTYKHCSVWVWHVFDTRKFSVSRKERGGGVVIFFSFPGSTGKTWKWCTCMRSKFCHQQWKWDNHSPLSTGYLQGSKWGKLFIGNSYCGTCGIQTDVLGWRYWKVLIGPSEFMGSLSSYLERGRSQCEEMAHDVKAWNTSFE